MWMLPPSTLTRRLCYAFLNRGSCDRPECTFRHLLPGHPDAVADRVKNGQAHKVPASAFSSSVFCGGGGGGGVGGSGAHGALGGAPRPMGAPPPMLSRPMGPDPTLPMMGAELALAPPPTPPTWDPGAAFRCGGHGFAWDGVQWAPPMWPPHGPAGPPPPGAMPPPMMPFRHPPPPHAAHDARRVSEPPSLMGNMRLCFNFLNKGFCDKGGACRFRHLPPDHPDAIADRVRSGRVPPAGLHAPTPAWRAPGPPPPGMGGFAYHPC